MINMLLYEKNVDSWRVDTYKKLGFEYVIGNLL